MDKPGIEDIAVGDRVVIVAQDPAQDSGEQVWATVTEVSQVGIALAGGGREWRMRWDTQGDGTERFMTPEQVAWELV